MDTSTSSRTWHARLPTPPGTSLLTAPPGTRTRFPPYHACQVCFRPTWEQLKDFCLKAKYRVWPWLSYMRHIRSTADARKTADTTWDQPLDGPAWHAYQARFKLILNPAPCKQDRNGNKLIIFQGLQPESQGKSLALTVLCVPHSLDSGSTQDG